MCHHTQPLHKLLRQYAKLSSIILAVYTNLFLSWEAQLYKWKLYVFVLEGVCIFGDRTQKHRQNNISKHLICSCPFYWSHFSSPGSWTESCLGRSSGVGPGHSSLAIRPTRPIKAVPLAPTFCGPSHHCLTSRGQDSQRQHPKLPGLRPSGE